MKEEEAKMGLSPEQNDVVIAPIENILVSAAAGSGKTTVLVARIIEKICNGTYDADDILVVTFTREAASNMCAKIESAISEKIRILRENGGDRELRTRLEDQLDKLPNAYIQTIDSFCSRVVKEKGYVLSGSGKDRLLEPGNVVLDGNELDLILKDAANAAVAQSYEEGLLNSDFETLTQMFGNGRTDDALAESLVISYKQLRSLPDYLDRAHSMLERTQEACDEGRILCLDKFNRAVVTFYSKLDESRRDKMLSLVQQIRFLAKDKDNEKRQQIWSDLIELYYEYASNVVKVAAGGDDLTTFKAILDVSKISADNNPGIYNGLPKKDEEGIVEEFIELFEPIASIAIFLKPLLGIARAPGGYSDIAKAFGLQESYTAIAVCGAEGLLDKQKNRLLLARQYIDLITRMDKFYEEFKALVHGMDFPDQEHLALQILKNEDAKTYYRSKFKEIYIDEYQDNSELQDAIIAEIEDSNVFRVGDVKQSIYKFRYAEPSLFLDRLNEYDKGDSGNLFVLNNNYRSDESILEFVNRIFYRIMGAEGAEIEYDSKQALNYPDNKERKDTLPPDIPHVTVVTHTKNGDRKACVNEGVLKEVRRYLTAGRGPGDICILTRTHRTASMIASYLNENGCPARYADEIGVFNDNDIHGLCNILIAAGNELRDEYLVGILISGYRISNFTLDEIARVFMHAKAKHLGAEHLMTKLRLFASDNVKASDEPLQQRVAAFVEWFDSLRNDLIITDISELTDRIYKDTGVGADSDDPEKFLLFKQWLCTNFMRYGSDISSIASRLEKMKIELSDKTSVKREDNSDGKIRCMTYHSSKGLEFKSVIVTELSSRSRKDSVGSVVFDPTYGTVTDDFDPVRYIKYKSLERVFLEEDQMLGENAEQMRLLYVALTRAEHELSVVIPMECETFKSYANLYSLLRRQTEDRCTRAFWLKCHGMESAFLAALLSFSGAKELRYQIGSTVLKGDFKDISNEVKFDGFTVDIVHNSAEVEDDGAEREAEDTDDGDATEEAADVVHEVQTKKTTGIIDICAESFDEAGMPIFAPYGYEKATTVPFKISVSQIVHHGVDGSLPINLEVHNLEHYMDVRDGITDDSASAVGTFIHRIMRFIDLKKAGVDAEAQIDELIDEGIISSSDRAKAMEFKEGIASFASSDVGKKLVAADDRGEAEYEKPIVFSVPSGDDSVLVQGVIDCMFRGEDDRYTIIDYKTDRFPADITDIELISETIKRHSVQLGCYSAALRSSGKDVGEKYIYLVRYGKFVEV